MQRQNLKKGALWHFYEGIEMPSAKYKNLGSIASHTIQSKSMEMIWESALFVNNIYFMVS